MDSVHLVFPEGRLHCRHHTRHTACAWQISLMEKTNINQIIIHTHVLKKKTNNNIKMAMEGEVQQALWKNEGRGHSPEEMTIQ